ncbi:MAG: hypothetical protein WEF28_12765 [Acidimicrobiia bacterium]
MRRFVVLVVVLATGVATAAPVLAGPNVYPPEPVDFTVNFEAGFPCDFDLEAHVWGKSGYIEFDDRAISIAPGLRVTLTNTESDESITNGIGGVLHDTILGDVLRTKWTGHNVMFGVIDGEPGMFLTVGKIVTESSFDDLSTMTIIKEESPGKLIDVCALLSD